MDELQQQTWLAFTAERDLHNEAKKEVAAKERDIENLRCDKAIDKRAISQLKHELNVAHYELNKFYLEPR